MPWPIKGATHNYTCTVKICGQRMCNQNIVAFDDSLRSFDEHLKSKTTLSYLLKRCHTMLVNVLCPSDLLSDAFYLFLEYSYMSVVYIWLILANIKKVTSYRFWTRKTISKKKEA